MCITALDVSDSIHIDHGRNGVHAFLKRMSFCPQKCGKHCKVNDDVTYALKFRFICYRYPGMALWTGNKRTLRKMEENILQPIKSMEDSPCGEECKAYLRSLNGQFTASTDVDGEVAGSPLPKSPPLPSSLHVPLKLGSKWG